MTDSFEHLFHKIRGFDWSPPRTLVTVDPGETCGWAVFKQGILTSCNQVSIPVHKDGRVVGSELWDLIEDNNPEIVVVEGYRVYASKVAQHTWSALYTPKLIGYIEAICDRFKIPLTLQMASTKSFCSNNKLKAWGYYKASMPHAMDAVRHGCYYLLFHGRATQTSS
ncbi:MAG: hypothetical protein WC239_02410 [Sphaerochaetaceae bacterium]|jgi:hypothetical protein